MSNETRQMLKGFVFSVDKIPLHEVDFSKGSSYNY